MIKIEINSNFLKILAAIYHHKNNNVDGELFYSKIKWLIKFKLRQNFVSFM